MTISIPTPALATTREPKSATSDFTCRTRTNQQQSSKFEGSLKQPTYFKPNPYLSVWTGHSFTHTWPSTHESETCPRCRKGWYSDCTTSGTTITYDPTETAWEHPYEMTTINHYGIQYCHQRLQRQQELMHNNRHNKHNRNFSASLMQRRESMSNTSSVSSYSSWAALLGLKKSHV